MGGIPKIHSFSEEMGGSPKERCPVTTLVVWCLQKARKSGLELISEFVLTRRLKRRLVK